MKETQLVFGALIVLVILIVLVGLVLVIDIFAGRRSGDDAGPPIAADDDPFAGDRGPRRAAYELARVPSVEELRARIREAPPGKIREVLRELASYRYVFGRDAILEETVGWLAGRNVNHVRWAALALLEQGNPDSILADLYDACSTAIADRRDLVEFLGNQVATILENRLAKEQLSDEERESLLHALIRFGGLGPDRERGLFVAAALGGATEGNDYAIAHLAELVRESDDPGVKGLAARRLGKVGRVEDLLDLTGMRLDPPPTTPGDIEICAGFVGGLTLAVTRLPEEISLAISAFDKLLRQWNQTQEQDDMRLEILEHLTNHPAPELEATLSDLAAEGSASIAAGAEKALWALFKE